MQFVVEIATLNASDSVNMRPLLLVLLVVAVILILIGCCIAILSLKNQQKDKIASIIVENSDSRPETP